MTDPEPDLERAVRRFTWFTVHRDARGDFDIWASCSRCGAGFWNQWADGDGGPIVTLARTLWSELAPPEQPVQQMPGEDVNPAREEYRQALLDVPVRSGRLLTVSASTVSLRGWQYVRFVPSPAKAGRNPVGVANAPDAVLVFHDGDSFTVLPELSAPPTAPGAPRPPGRSRRTVVLSTATR